MREGSFEGVPHDSFVEITDDEVHASRERWSTGRHEQVDAKNLRSAQSFCTWRLIIVKLSFSSLGGQRICTRATTASNVQFFA